MGLGKLIKTSVRKITRWADSGSTREYPQDIAMPSSYGTTKALSMDDNINGMNFTVLSATGGKVIKFTTYDPARDRHRTELYIVTDKEDLGQELGMIITKESLTR